MKKLFLFIAFCFSIGFSNAQDFSYGIVGGTHVYSIETKGGIYNNAKNDGFNTDIGVFGNYQLNEKLSLRLNLLYSSLTEKYDVKPFLKNGIGGPIYKFYYAGKNYFYNAEGSRVNGKYKQPDPTDNLSFNHHLKEIQFTPLLKYSLNQRFYALGGIHASLLLNAENKHFDGKFNAVFYRPSYPKKKLDIKDFYHSLTFGTQLGAGVNFLKHFSFEVLGYYGFSNILKDNDTSATTIGVFGLLKINLASLI